MTSNPDSSLEISVIIPVYNAEKFVKRAVESALSQPEIAEIILVEDASPDNSYAICQLLTKKHDKVHLFTHENNINLGAGASRNLGIQNSNFDYIAFLDADDFYLRNRFERTKKVLLNKPDADGVYEAIGVHFESESVKKRWLERTNGSLLTSVGDGIPPDKLFWNQSPVGKKGHTHLDGLTVKKSALQKVGLFDPILRLHQDSELFMRLAMACILLPGELKKPVAMRGVHEDNRITNKLPIEKAIENFRKMLKSTQKWAEENGYNKEADEIKKRIMFSRLIKANGGDYNNSISSLRQYFLSIKETPIILVSPSFHIYLSKFLIRYFFINRW